MTATRSPRTAIVLFTRDLRVHDHEGLTEAVAGFERVAPLFVLDDRILNDRAANRTAFLLEALDDLRSSLQRRGADLLVRRGDPVEEALKLVAELDAETIFLSADVSRYAQRREERLARACRSARTDLRLRTTTTVVPPGALTPSDRDHYRVFTPYWRRWSELAPPRPQPAADHLRLPDGAEAGALPSLRELTRRQPSPGRARGGEAAGRRRMRHWLARGLAGYADGADRLDLDATSRLSPYLHFGCVSPQELVARASGREGSEGFVRQLCWRDFFHQLHAARSEMPRDDLRPPEGESREHEEAFTRWRDGLTGYPVVDAGMRQLRHEGWLPNRARLVVGWFLTKTMRLDWRLGAEVFFEELVDGDVANNIGNWQWVAGTGADKRPNRVFNPLRQALRFDPEGDYVHRWIPELAGVHGRGAHEPRKNAGLRAVYPEPIVDQVEAVATPRPHRRAVARI